MWQQEGLVVERSARGWPFYEQRMSCLLKEAKPPGHFRLPGVAGAPGLWAKRIDFGLPEGVYSRAPLSPTRFDADLTLKVFTNGADRSVVSELYEATLAAGFASLRELSFPLNLWVDADVFTLLEALQEVPHPNVHTLNLSFNTSLTDDALRMLGSAIRAGALGSLETVYLSGCTLLRTLPPELAQLSRLSLLDLGGCKLTSLPDLSKLESAGQLQVKGLPVALGAAWESIGRRPMSADAVARVLRKEHAIVSPVEQSS